MPSSHAPSPQHTQQNTKPAFGTEHPISQRLSLGWALDALGGPLSLTTAVRDPRAALGLGGVYVIWQQAPGGVRWIHVGAAADVGSTLKRLAADPRLQAHGGASELRVSWAAVAALHLSGVLQYLTDLLQPAVHERRSAAAPIAVNLPH